MYSVFTVFHRLSQSSTEWQLKDFFDVLDRHTARFVELFKSKHGVVGERLQELVGQTDLNGKHALNRQPI